VRSGPVYLGQGSLDSDGRGEGLGTGGGGGTELVPDGLEDMAVVRFDRLPQQRIVAGEGFVHAHGLGVLLPEAGAALDAGAEEGDGAGRQRAGVHGFASPSGTILSSRRGVPRFSFSEV
jgi:hypothetical protein